MRPHILSSLGVLVLSLSGSVMAAQQGSPATSATSKTAAAKPVVDADGVYHVGNGVTPPILVYSVDAEFSDAARHRKMEATVEVALTVLLDGGVADVRVKRSAAENFTKPKDRKAAATLDPKALDAVRQFRFKPARYEGKPVPVAISVEVNFHIY